KIYQRGLTWIFWGTVHLIVYRAVNHYLTISPQEVGNVSDLARYMFANYLLYLRVSGQFHMIVGILHLFGFQLPRAYNLYYLASGFTDFWRRSNIYWKDFMQKVFFYPTYFRLRKVKGTTALILSTFVVFFVTWFLHAYQWFWLRAEFFTSAPDILFWVFLATFLTINMIRESKRGRKQTLRAQGKTFKEIASLSLRTIGMFVAMCVLWAFWTSPTLADWVALWSLAEITLPSLLGLIPAFVMLFLVFSVAHWLDAGGAETWMKRTKGSKKPGFYRKAIVTGGMTLLLLVVGQPWFAARLGGRAQGVLTDMRLSRLSGRDAILLDRGYYENLIGVNQFNSQLWEIYAKRPDDWPAIWETEAARLTDDFLKYELAPSVKFTYHGAAFSTNRWAMRDKDYEKTPLPDTFRIAFFGSSISMGSGVANDKTFEAIVEARLNQEQNTYAYEILNVSVGGYTALQKLAALETRALSFEPDALFYVPHPNHEKIRALLHLAEMVRLDIDLPFDYLEDIVVQAGIDANTPELAATKQLEPYGDEILSWAYGQIAEQSRQRGVLPVWVYVPSTPEYVENSEDAANMIRIAEEAGFIILDLSNAYDAQEDRTALFIAEWDFHPNGQGHQMLAESLYQALLENYDFIFTKPEDDSGG
ncbi:MAG: GDSL-type esterase/lipase family protein, partial [Anaerolineales bacterium]